MINQVLLMGKICYKSDLEKSQNGECKGKITLSVQKPFKNSQGEFESEKINVSICGAMAQSVCGYTTEKDIVCINGRIHVNNDNSIEIIADKVIVVYKNSKQDDGDKDGSSKDN